VRDSERGGTRVGRIVELEAYIGEDDLASHARFGPTARNRVMYGPPGTAYVYLVYGMYDCLNIVTEPAGRPAALLVRAVEPIEGGEAMRIGRIETMERRRRLEAETLRAERDRIARLPTAHLARGPGLVAAAFGIDRSMTGLDVLAPTSPLRVEPARDGDREAEPVATPRVGIGYAGEPWTGVPWRLLDASSPSVSGPRPRRT
jgi:DNA-3-methyladenine glycosylase